MYIEKIEQKGLSMGKSALKHKSKKWFRWRKSFRSSSRWETTLTVHLQDIIYKNTSREDDDAKDLRMLHVGAAKLSTSQHDVAAAIVIQVHFRRHLVTFQTLAGSN